MKELSIEEKAKAYDEAKARMSRAFNSNRCTIGFMNEIFPELKESRDERIIERILFSLQKDIMATKNSGCSTKDLEKCIAWLEKQGKNNMGISEATKKKLEDSLNKALEKETPESFNEFLEKQGEQNPAWSEEDEKILSDIIKDLVHPWNEYIPDRIEDEIKWLKKRLKSLKDRYTWKPSDEQMDALETAVSSLQSTALESLYNDLKELREK